MKLETKDARQGTDSRGTERDGDPSLQPLVEERGISARVLAAAGIHIDTGSGRHSGWWVIPYPHRFGTWKQRYRNPDPQGRPKYLDDPNADFHLYNPLRLGPGEEEVWFAEGEFDTLALIDQGLKAIGIHGVSNVTDEEELSEARGFKRQWALLFEDTLCITMFDNDEAGLKAGRRLARGLNGEAFDEWDDSYSDINDWHRADPASLAVALDRFRRGVRRSRGLES